MDRWKRRRSTRLARRRGSRGAALVEFAMVSMLLFSLLFAILDFGIAYNDWSSLRHGTREGARQAVVGNVSTNAGCSLTGMPVTATNDTKKMFCLIKERIGLDPANIRVMLDFEGVDYVQYDSLTVCATYPLRSVSGMFSSVLDGRYVRAEVQMRIERDDADLVEAAETPHQDWTWCKAEVTT